jgi:hypothetical protein
VEDIKNNLLNTTFHYADATGTLRLAKMKGLVAIKQNEKECLYDTLNYVAKGKVKVIAKTFSLDDTGDGYEKVANGNVCIFML